MRFKNYTVVRLGQGDSRFSFLSCSTNCRNENPTKETSHDRTAATTRSHEYDLRFILRWDGGISKHKPLERTKSIFVSQECDMKSVLTLRTLFKRERESFREREGVIGLKIRGEHQHWNLWVCLFIDTSPNAMSTISSWNLRTDLTGRPVHQPVDRLPKNLIRSTGLVQTQFFRLKTTLVSRENETHSRTMCHYKSYQMLGTFPRL